MSSASVALHLKWLALVGSLFMLKSGVAILDVALAALEPALSK